MNVIHQSLAETMSSQIRSHCNYKERQFLKNVSMEEQIHFMLPKIRRRERLVRWGFVSFYLLGMSAFLFVGRSGGQPPFGMFFNFFLMCHLTFQTITSVRQSAVSITKVETLVDLWLRQQQSSLAEFDSRKASINPPRALAPK